MNIPNTLTAIRFLLIPIFIKTFYSPVQGNLIYSGLVYMAAGITDFFDGYIARRYNMVTTWGKLMDPLADKLMLITALLCLTHTRSLPAAIVIVVIAKEILIIIGAMLLYKKGRVAMGSHWCSRCATFVFFIGIIMNLLNFGISKYILITAVILAVISLVKYYIDYKNINKKKCDNPVSSQ